MSFSYFIKINIFTKQSAENKILSIFTIVEFGLSEILLICRIKQADIVH